MQKYFKNIFRQEKVREKALQQENIPKDKDI